MLNIFAIRLFALGLEFFTPTPAAARLDKGGFSTGAVMRILIYDLLIHPIRDYAACRKVIRHTSHLGDTAKISIFDRVVVCSAKTVGKSKAKATKYYR